MLTGVVKAARLAELIAGRGGALHQIEVLRSLLESGRIDDAVRLCLEGRGLEPFLALWRESATSTRIGLLLLAEEALEMSETVFDGVVTQIISVLESPDGALRGDTADLLGQIAHPAAVEALTALCHDGIDDVAEIAVEALDEVLQRKRLDLGD